MEMCAVRRATLVGPLVVLSLFAATRAAAEDKAEPQYAVKTVEGFPVHVAGDLLTTHEALGEKALRLLESHLYNVSRVVPAKALAELRKVHVWLHYKGKGRCGAYHPSRGWLEEHGWNPEMARSVDLGGAEGFMKSSRHQPFLVLHELSHAYHHQVLGYGNREIKEAHKRAARDKTYERVLIWNGRRGRAYAITNPMEYFAETSEAFFGTNDVYPFVRAELRAHDPEMFKLLKKLWAGPPEKAGLRRHGAHRQDAKNAKNGDRSWERQSGHRSTLCFSHALAVLGALGVLGGRCR